MKKELVQVKAKKIWDDFKLSNIKYEALSEDMIEQTSYILALLKLNAYGVFPDRKQLDEEAFRMYLNLIIEKLKRDGLVTVEYGDDGKDIESVVITDRGKEQVKEITKHEELKFLVE